MNINFGAAISAHEHVKIGDRVRMGPYAIVMDSDYHAARDRGERPTAPIIIEEDVWLAGRVSVLRGSRIGRGSVITAGSVVSGEIPAGVIAGGVPARVIRRIEGSDRAFVDWSQPTAEARPGAATSPANAGHSVARVVRGRRKGKPRPNAPPPQQQTNGAPASGASPADEEVDRRVLTLIAATFSLEGPVQASWGPKEIPKWDSLGQLRLTFSLEETFKINISETQLTEMTTVSEVCRVVRSCLASPALLTASSDVRDSSSRAGGPVGVGPCSGLAPAGRGRSPRRAMNEMKPAKLAFSAPIPNLLRWARGQSPRRESER